MVKKANKSSKAEVHSQLHSPNVGLLELCSLISMFFCFYFHFLNINLIVQPIQNDSSFNDFTRRGSLTGSWHVLVAVGAKFTHFLSPTMFSTTPAPQASLQNTERSVSSPVAVIFNQLDLMGEKNEIKLPKRQLKILIVWS